MPFKSKLARSIVTAVLTTMITPAMAETLSCGIQDISVDYQNAEHAQLVCDAALTAASLFQQCNVPALSRPVLINVTEDVKEGCAALYHCDEDTIDILSPTSMKTVRKPGGSFYHLTATAYFQSIVVHELAHAAIDDMPCPFDACVVADEYVAYAIQIMSLDKDDRAAFEMKSQLRKSISSDELSSMILFMAPDLFAQKVWRHLSQRADPCGYIGDLANGRTLLDRERF